MVHTGEHEHRILAFALGDPPPDAGTLELLEQLSSCEHCIGYGYRAMADLSLLAENQSGAGGAVKRLEEVLGEAADAWAHRAAPVAEPEAVRAWTRWARLARMFPLQPAMGVALAAGLTLLVAIGGVERRNQRLDQVFLAEQLEQVLDALPARYSFAPGPPPSAYWRGYAAELLVALERRGLAEELLLPLREDLAESAPAAEQDLARLASSEERCRLLTADAIQETACQQGAFGFHLQRRIEATHRGDNSVLEDRTLRDDSSQRFLDWALGKSRQTPTPAGLWQTASELDGRRRQGLAPNGAEVVQWSRLVKGLLRDD